MIQISPKNEQGFITNNSVKTKMTYSERDFREAVDIGMPSNDTEFYGGHQSAKSQPRKQGRLIKLTISVLSALQAGHLTMVFPNGETHVFEGAQEGPRAEVHFYNLRPIKRFLIGGKLGFCETYLDGDWSSPDIAAFFNLILINSDIMKREMEGKPWARFLSRLLHVLKPNSKSGSRKNIYSHYDLGNDFYAAWLDKTMTYSSALFDGTSQTMEQAQNAKYQAMIDRLGITKDMHVLEIGCGWGGFAEYAARTTGCKVTGITISGAQYQFARERMKHAGLDDLVSIEMRDYRDLENQYDAIVSIEMFEAVGEAYWPTYFKTLQKSLKDGAQACLQIITIRDQDFEAYRKSADYIQRYIFPGGMLPSRGALSAQIEKAGLQEGHSHCFGKDYARTLAIWNEDFQKAWPQISKNSKFDARFKRLWEQYLCYCQAGFETDVIDVVHIDMQKTA